MKFSVIIDKLKRYPVAVICTALIIAFLVVIFLRGGVATELSVQEGDLNARIRTIDENIKNSKDLEQDATDLDIIVEKINSLLFNRYERAINVNFFYGLEDKADVVISNISQMAEPDPIYDEGGARALKLHSTLVFDITLSGSFTNILKLLYEVEQNERLLRVADCQVSRERDENGGANVVARLRVLALAEKE